MEKFKLIVLSLHFCVIILFLTCIISNNLNAQHLYSLRLKNNKEILGKAVYDTLNNIYLVRTEEGDLYEILPEDIEFISSAERVIFPPSRDQSLPSGDCIPCKDSKWYVVEAGLASLWAKDHYTGIDFNFGFRVYHFSIGPGMAYYDMLSTSRFNYYLHIRYNITKNCLNPFAYADAGFLFDKYTSKYGVKPAFNFDTNPRLLTAGIGLEYPVTKTLNLQLDGGYKFMDITREVQVPTCNGAKPVLSYRELHLGFIRLGVNF